MKSSVGYICTECGAKSAKWMGRCQSCGAWDSFEEYDLSQDLAPAAGQKRPRNLLVESASAPQRLRDGAEQPAKRTKTGIGEFDRVLGGGIVDGSVVLLSGEPGIGKSTLLLQIFSRAAANAKVLYVSGEESFAQLKMRADRLGVSPENLYLYTETDMQKILEAADRLQPDFIVADSIQTMYDPSSSASPGSISQVRSCASVFVARAKNTGTAVLLVGHVNKEGGISGPKALEHIVDAVLHFEGDRTQAYRIIRAVKNRYGSTNEIGVFEMTETGLAEVENPSETLLSESTDGTSGCAAVCVMEGTRPIVAEIQALVTPTVFPSARRNANGVDYNRLCLIIAVLEKRLGMKFWQNDVYINVTGGLRLDTPSADLAIALALISSMTDRPVKKKPICFGELGLGGECRASSFGEIRVKEADRLGFGRMLMPAKNKQKLTAKPSLELREVRTVSDLLLSLEKKAETDPEKD